MTSVPAVRTAWRGRRSWLAVGVHCYTASGGVLGLAAIVATANHELRAALLLLAIAVAIDATDGTLARLAVVNEHTPGIDGGRLDALVDLINFALAPAVFAFLAGLLPPPAMVWAGGMLAASLVRFARRDTRQRDRFVLLPNCWHVVVFYGFYLQWSPRVFAAIVLVVIVLMSCPGQYPHPTSHSTRWWHAAIAAFALLAVGGVIVGALRSRAWLLLSLAYPAFYLGQAIWMTIVAGAKRASAGTSPGSFPPITGNYQYRLEVL